MDASIITVKTAKALFSWCIESQCTALLHANSNRDCISIQVILDTDKTFLIIATFGMKYTK